MIRSPPQTFFPAQARFRGPSMGRYDLEMANLSKSRASSSLPDLTKGQEVLLECFERGETPADIAKRKYPKDAAKRKALRRKLWRTLQRDSRLQQAVAERGKANLTLGIIPATIGLANRGGRKTDAARVVLEATGVHNPRVQHEHSGDVNITLNIPRPALGDDTPVHGHDDEED